MSLATYTFVSHARRGFAPDPSGEARVTVQVAGQAAIEHDVTLMGPGDVVGVAPGQVIRTWPRDGVHNAEPNYLALLELDAPDLPWLFGRPAAGGRFHPWLMLVVIRVDELDHDPLVLDDRGARVTVPADQKPDPADAWLWAHAQLLGADTVPDDPARSLARVVCPRRLEPGAGYLACLVPAFEAGRRAGLGEEVPAEVRSRTTPGWDVLELPVYHWFRFSTGPSGDFESLVRRLRGIAPPQDLGRLRLRLDHPLSDLPSSGVDGDLELHVALRPTGSETRPVADLVGADYLQALRSRLADADYDVSQLGDRPPRVGPPVHGQLPVGTGARAAALGTATVPPWLSELNLDPRHRVAAGLGAEVVRRNQEHYVEEAWRQVGDVLAANRLRRRAEFSLAATGRLYDRWIATLDAGDLVTATSPLHAKVLVAPGETIVGRLRDSPLPPAVVSVALRRFARDRGGLAHATDWQQAVGVGAVTAHSTEQAPLTQRVALDGVERLEPPSTIWDGAALHDILTRLVDSPEVADLEPDVAAEQLDAITSFDSFSLPTAETVAARVAEGRVDLDRTMTSIGLLPTTAVADVAPPREPQQPHRPGRSPWGVPGHDEVRVRRAGGRDLDLSTVLRPTEVLETVRDHPALVSHVGEDRVVLDTVRLAESARTGRAATTIDRSTFDDLVAGTFTPAEPATVEFEVPASRATGIVTELGEAAVALAGLEIRSGDAEPRPGRPLAGGLESLREPLLRALDPATTIRLAVNSRISALQDGEDEALDDIMVAPDLSEPTYRQLSDLSHDWLLPGLDDLPADTTTLVAANLEFIASFLVGMNHELARELLWREYPTDLRGSYARQFWTHLANRTPEDRFDLRRPLHRADDSTLPELTLPADAVGGPPQDPLVLVVKGDLVHRYPGLIVVAATTTDDGTGHRVPRAPMPPDFAGLLEPDVLLLGFTRLTAQQVRDAEVTGHADDRWWFFFAEHFTEPRFGLDDPDGAPPVPPGSWNDASWAHVARPTDRFLGGDSFVGTDGQPLLLPKGFDLSRAASYTWGSTAADQAWITLQFPFRRGIPAGQLLPPEDST